jgi:tetratricopeptide (TPR) repeat protein
VFRAAQLPAAEPSTGLHGRHPARARLDAGRSAVDAGALESGLRSLELAAREARACDDAALEGQAQLALGTALVHSAQDRDEEGARALERAAELSTVVGNHAVGAAAMRELAYIDVLQGRFARCEFRLAQAGAVADTDEERAGVEGVLGLAAIDMGRHDLGIAHVSRSIELAERSGSPKQLVFSLGLLGRSRLIREEWSEASETLERAVSLAQREWMAYVPWVGSLLAEVELRNGSADAASPRLEHAYTLGCHLGDGCSEGLARHGLALVAAMRGDKEAAVAQLEMALRRVKEVADVYVWLEAYILDSLCELAVTAAPDRLEDWSAALSTLAARTGMREWSIRIFLRHAAEGDLRAAATARLLLRSVDNPALSERVEAATASASSI